MWQVRRALALRLSVHLLLGVAACADEPWREPPREVPPARTASVELIGINGRRLDDGDVYRVPLDSDRAVAVGATTREAMVVVNNTDAPVAIEWLTVAGVDWQVLTPTYAVEVALLARGTLLPPGARLDFDVAVRPERNGDVRATLSLALRTGRTWDVRRIELRANATGPPTTYSPTR